MALEGGALTGIVPLMPGHSFSDTEVNLRMPFVPTGHYILSVMANAIHSGQMVLVTGLGAPHVAAPGVFITDKKPDIQGTAEAGSTVTVWLDGKEEAAIIEHASGVWRFTPATELTHGPHDIEVIARDAAGNISPSAKHRFIIQRSHYGWSCASAPALPAAWALLALGLLLGRRWFRCP
jgi:hypothetical protein